MVALVIGGPGLVVGGESEAARVSGRVALPRASVAAVVDQRYEVVIEAGMVRTDPPRAVVFLVGEFPAATKRAEAKIEQRDLAFVPRLLAVRVGTRVDFPNVDPVYHNVFSFSPTKRFDLGRYRADEADVPGVVFDRPGLVTLRCDIHEHMRAAVLVVDTPCFTITDAEGRFALGDIPPGRYVLKAWIDSRTTKEQVIVLKAGEARVVDFP